MKDTYVIFWRNKETGATGRSKDHYTQEEACALCAEMNRKYPKYTHEVIPTDAEDPKQVLETPKPVVDPFEPVKGPPVDIEGD